jgi:hypothetical protein
MSAFAEQDVVLLVRTLARIAEALERGYPPLVSPPKEDTKASKDELVTKVTNDTTSNMEYRGSQLFFTRGPCSNLCPKCKSCIEYQPGEECIGWKTPRFKGGK